MIIPIKCFTCGTVIANRYQIYCDEVRLRKMQSSKYKNDMDRNRVEYFTHENINKTIEGNVLDELGLTKMCCRRHMLTHVDIE
jgi:DNA-directed RNA polymerase I, II, and III subunit RPABC5